MTNTDDPLWIQEWTAAVDSSIQVLASVSHICSTSLQGPHGLQRSGVGNWLYLADWHEGGTKRLLSSHLACFHAGNFIYVSISGNVLSLQKTDRPRNEGRKIAEEPDHRRLWLRTERGLLEHLRKFAVSFIFYPHAGGRLTSVRTGIGPEMFAWKTADGNSTERSTPEDDSYYQVIPACDTPCYAKRLKPSSDAWILPTG